MFKVVLAALIVGIISGCASAPKELTLAPFGGSRADGVIEMGYLGGYSWVKNINWDKSLKVAVNRCVSWGYQGSEKFGIGQAVCISDNGASGAFKMCKEAKYIIEYQCTGKRLIN